MEYCYAQIEHRYPKNIRILDNPYLSSLTALISQESTTQPAFNNLVRDIYRELFINIINQEWPQVQKTLDTRMTSLHPEQQLQTSILDPQQKAVCVDVARAGMLPSQIFFDHLNTMANPQGLRLDHIFASRVTNQTNEVTHTELSSSKIGGDVDKAFVFLPDPMGATGNSLCEVIDHYKQQVPGQPTAFVSAHMIITPEFIRKVTETHPDTIVYAVRVDRGFSSAEALAEVPGTLWDQEKGLNDSQYIVPGAGGVGELINNSFV